MATKHLLTPVVNPETLQMTVQEQALEPQTWTSDVLVPLTQNLCGGIAVGVLGFIGFLARSQWRQILWSADDALFWCSLAGGAVSCLVTILRFFGDDLGVIAAAYNAGRRSMLPRISALEEHLQAAQDVLQDRQQPTSAEARLLETMGRAKTDAERLIRLHFAGDKIDRNSMSQRGMGQRDWERARRLLQAAGVLHGNGRFAVETPMEGVRRLSQRLTLDAQRQASYRSYSPSWR
jgi:hypothetical protein